MSLVRTFIATLAVALALSLGLVWGKAADRDREQAPNRSSAPSITGNLPNLADVADRAIQASVNISSTQQVQRDQTERLFFGGDAVESQTSLGSGVFVSSDGYLLTNSHVVRGARADVRVTLADNREFPGKVIGLDPVSDLAVVKVGVTGVATLPWGDSSKLRPAEWVLAVGNPFQFNQTVTLGIVSATNRYSPELDVFTDFIQTDAAINPGNSGGALVSARGELVGINTMIYSRTGGYQGIGFAVPSNLARQILQELQKTGTVVRGSIGTLALQTISAAQARSNGLGDRGGIFIARMFQREPAFGAGIRPGDIIVGFNGQDISDPSQLLRQIAAAKIGSTVRIDVISRGTRRTFEVPVVQMTPPPGR